METVYSLKKNDYFVASTDYKLVRQT